MDLFTVEAASKVEEDAVGAVDPVPVAIVVSPRGGYDTWGRRNNSNIEFLETLLRELPMSCGNNVEGTRLVRLIVLSHSLCATAPEAEAEVAFGPSPAHSIHQVPPLITSAVARTFASS